MNREIKFRGKRIDNGEWVYGQTIYQNDGRNCMIYYLDGFNAKYIDINPNTLGQFTGLTDKNGKDIYEGDKLFDDDMTDDNYIILWEQSYASFGLFIEDKDDLISLRQCDYLTITDEVDLGELHIEGNIHDKDSEVG
jgi:uncharacterized phage protein (TIGR01671 family)